MKRVTESGYEYCDRHLKATELRLGLPWSADEEQPPPPAAAPEKSNYISYNKNKNKRSSPETTDDDNQDLNLSAADDDNSSISDARNNVDAPPPSKTQIVGWPPVRSYRKNSLQLQNSMKCENNGNYVKVSMDGAAYLRKIDLKMYNNYPELQNGIETMFKVKIGKYSEREGYINDGSSLSDYAPTYEDKDGDWMLVGDVPWDMFTSSCKRLRVMKSSEVKGLGGCI